MSECCYAGHSMVVAVSANAAYGAPLLVAVGSLAQSCTLPVKFIILDGGLSARQKELITRVVENCTIQHILEIREIDETPFRKFRLMNGNAMAYTRLLLPEILKEDWVLYADADTLWKCDAARLWGMREDHFSAVATADCADSAQKDDGVPGEYFCSGIMLLNLKYWRENDVSGKCCSWLTEHPEARFWDQSALNRVLKGSVKLVDKSWNRYVGEDGPCNVLHYAGANPWCFGIRKNRLDRYKLTWFRELARLKGSTTLGEIFRAKFD